MSCHSVLPLVSIVVVSIVVLLSTGVADEFSVLGGDVRRYSEYFGGGTPYRDFPVEYPPLTLGLAIGFPLVIIGSVLGTSGREPPVAEPPGLTPSAAAPRPIDP